LFLRFRCAVVVGILHSGFGFLSKRTCGITKTEKHENAGQTGLRAHEKKWPLLLMLRGKTKLGVVGFQYSTQNAGGKKNYSMLP
jgi:hypothetical protein